MRSWCVIGAVSLLASFWPAQVFAQDSPPLLMEALAFADVIAEAEIIDVQARWEGGLVVSTISTEITTCVKGQCPQEVVRFDILGGEIDGVVQVVSGSQVPQLGQAMVLVFSQSPDQPRSFSAVRILPLVEDLEGRLGVQLQGSFIEVND